MSSISALPLIPPSKNYQGDWALNTATSVATNTGVPITTAASQWSPIGAVNNINATSLLNSAGAIVIPTKGTYTVTLGSVFYPNSTTTTTGTPPAGEFDAWFIYQTASSSTTYAPRFGWVAASWLLVSISGSTYTWSPPILNTSHTFSCNAGDVITPYVFHTSGVTKSLSAPSNGASGSAAPFSTIPVVLGCKMINNGA